MKSSRNVIMLHSVGSNHTNWTGRHLSVDAVQFEALCQYLSSHNYKTDFLSRWYYLEDYPKEKTGKELFLTFDDGYLDNLLVAYPVMKKYGVKGTIFVNPEFIDPSSGVRTIKDNNGETLGFLNWDEICFLDKSGVFDIQSHSMSHNFYFKSDKMIDIHTQQNKYHWLAWINKPEKKYAWQLENQKSYTPYGYPVFEYYRALGLRRYFPDDTVVEKSIELYKSGKDKEEIVKACTELLKEYPGRFETDEEMTKRYKYELFDSKRILEERLDKKIDYLCWPGGGYNEISLRIAEEAGYLASTIASREGRKQVDNKGKEYKRIVRFGMDSTIRKGYYFRKQRVVPTSFKRHLIWILKTEEHNPLYRFLAKANYFMLRFF